MVVDSTIDGCRWIEAAPPATRIRLALTKAMGEDEIRAGRLAGFVLGCVCKGWDPCGIRARADPLP